MFPHAGIGGPTRVEACHATAGICRTVSHAIRTRHTSSARLGGLASRHAPSMGLQSADTALAFAARTLATGSLDAALAAHYYLGVADGMLSAVQPDPRTDRDGASVNKAIGDALEKLLPMLQRAVRGAPLDPAREVAPMMTWIQIVRAQIRAARANVP